MIEIRAANMGLQSASRGYWVGAWSSLLTAILTIAFVIATLLFSPKAWNGIESYVAQYTQNEVLIWIPCFFFALTYLLVVVSIGNTLAPDKRLLYDAALSLAVVYLVVVFLNSYLQITAFRLNILSGRTGGLDLLALPNPHSITYALEGLGYTFLGLSTFILAFAFGSSRLEVAIRSLYIINGVVGVVGFLITALDMPMLMLPGIGIWSIEYPTVNMLLFFYCRRRARLGNFGRRIATAHSSEGAPAT